MQYAVVSTAKALNIGFYILTPPPKAFKVAFGRHGEARFGETGAASVRAKRLQKRHPSRPQATPGSGAGGCKELEVAQDQEAANPWI